MVLEGSSLSGRNEPWPLLVLKKAPADFGQRCPDADRVYSQEVQKVLPGLVSHAPDTTVTHADGSSEVLKDVLGVTIPASSCRS